MEERFRKLFDYLHDHHDLILVQSEEQDLAHIIDDCLSNNCALDEAQAVRQNEDAEDVCEHVWRRTGDPDRQSVRCEKCGLLTE